MRQTGRVANIEFVGCWPALRPNQMRLVTTLRLLCSLRSASGTWPGRVHVQGSLTIATRKTGNQAERGKGDPLLHNAPR